MNELDKMIRSLNLLNETELETLTEACQARVEEKKRARREVLRQELMGNLQKAIDDILLNSFSLTIENIDNPNWIVQFLPDEIYHIEIKQRVNATLILCKINNTTDSFYINFT